MELTSKYISEQLNGELIGDPNIKVTSPARIESGKPGNIVFLGNLKYEEYLYKSKASVIILNKSFIPKREIDATIIKVEDAYQAIASLLELFTNLKKSRKKGRSFFSKISWRSKIGKGCYIGNGVTIEKGVRIGKMVQIYPNCYIGDDVVVGDNTILYSGVRVYKGCVIGDNCIIHSNVVIGADGFGFAPMDDGSYKKIPQTGNVLIESCCEIGANTTIDRASIGSTIIRRGVKIDNLVQIAHNVEVGENSVIAAQCGVSGSVKIGKNCMIGGQVGISGHISIADGTKIGAQAGIMSTIKKEGLSYLGSPAMLAKDYLKAYAIFRNLHKK